MINMVAVECHFKECKYWNRLYTCDNLDKVVISNEWSVYGGCASAVVKDEEEQE